MVDVITDPCLNLNEGLNSRWSDGTDECLHPTALGWGIYLAMS